MKTVQYKLFTTALLGIFSIVYVLISSCNKTGGDYNYQNTENVYDGSSYAYIASKTGIYDSLQKAINRIQWLKDSLSNPNSSFTLFAPTNSSFRLMISTLNIARNNAGKPSLYIEDLDIDNLDTLISKYIVHGKITTYTIQFVDGLPLSTILYGYPMHGQKSYSDAMGFQAGGPTNIIYSDTKQSQFIRDWIRVQTSVVNIITTNGVVHTLVPEHELGFGEFVSRFI
ncbi:MAG: fasciclin domain-containing protein [Niabella sp.]